MRVGGAATVLLTTVTLLVMSGLSVQARNQAEAARDGRRISLAGHLLDADPSMAAAWLLDVEDPDSSRVWADLAVRLHHVPLASVEVQASLSSHWLATGRVLIEESSGDVEVWDPGGLSPRLAIRLPGAGLGLSLGAMFSGLVAAGSPDGTRVVMADRRDLRVHSTEDGALLADTRLPLATRHQVPRLLAWAPDGARVAATSPPYGWSVLDLGAGTAVGGLLRAQLDDLWFSPSGSQLLLLDDRQRVWTWPTDGSTTASLVLDLGRHHGPWRDEAGNLVSVDAAGVAWVQPLGDDGYGAPVAISLAPAISGAWVEGASAVVSTEAGQLAHRAVDSGLRSDLVGHQGEVVDVDLATQVDRLVSAGLDGVVRVQSRDGELRATWELAPQSVSGVRIAADGSYVVALLADGGATLLAVDSALATTRDLSSAAAIVEATFSPDSRWLLTWATDGSTRTWKLRTGLPTPAEAPPLDDLVQADFDAAGGRVIARSLDDGVQVRRAPGGRVLAGADYSEKLAEVTLSEGGGFGLVRSATGAADLVRLPEDDPGAGTFEPAWAARSCADAGVVDPHQEGGEPTLWGLDPGGSLWLRRGADGTDSFVVRPRQVASVVPDPSGHYLGLVEADGLIELVDLTLDPPDVVGHALHGSYLAFAPDGRRVVVADDGPVGEIWSLDDWSLPTASFSTPASVPPSRRYQTDLATLGGSAVTRLAFTVARLRGSRLVTSVRVEQGGGTAWITTTDGLAFALDLDSGHIERAAEATRAVVAADQAKNGWLLLATRDPEEVLRGQRRDDIAAALYPELHGPGGEQDPVHLTPAVAVAISPDGSSAHTLSSQGVLQDWPLPWESLRGRLRLRSRSCVGVPARREELGEDSKRAEDAYSRCEEALRGPSEERHDDAP